jgi:hypothetical protein
MVPAFFLCFQIAAVSWLTVESFSTLDEKEKTKQAVKNHSP